MPGVTVTVSSEVLMGGSRMAVTGSTGAYSFAALPPGIYMASAELQGFEPASHADVKVSINATSTVDFALEPAEFVEEMTVTGEAPLVDVASSGLATNQSAKFLQDLPTNRYFTDTLALTPGVVIGDEFNNPYHLVAFGSDMQSNNWSVDGIGVSNPTSGSNWILFNPATLEEMQVLGVGVPAEFGNLQGAAVNVVTKSGSNRLKGVLDVYWSNDALVDSDVGYEESEFSEFAQAHPFWDLSAALGGPIKQDRLWYFVAYESRQIGWVGPGGNPAKTNPEAAETYDLKLSSRINDRNLLNLRGGARYQKWPAVLREFSDASAMREEQTDATYWGVDYQYLLSDRTFLEARYSGLQAKYASVSQTGSTEPAYLDLEPNEGGNERHYGGLHWPFQYEGPSEQASFTVSHFADDFLGGDHDFKFGIQLSRGEGRFKRSPSATGTYYTHEYYYGYHYYYKFEGRPYYYGSDQETWGGFVDDSWAVTDRLTLNLGLRFDRAEGGVPSLPILNPGGDASGESTPALDPAFTWNNWSPRIGFAYNMGPARRTVIRGAFGVYYDGITGAAFNGPPPYIPTIYYWEGSSWEGPWESLGIWFSDNLTGSVDPNLRAPRTLQYSLGFEREFKNVYSVGATVMYKDSSDGIGWQILDDGVYEPFEWTDSVDGRTYTLLDPLEFPTIRKGNSPGFTVAGPLDNYWAEYKGLILTFNRRFADWWGLQASYTYSDSRGLAPLPMNWGQAGWFFGSKTGSHPNQWLNLEGGQQQLADVPHLFRVLANWRLPWNLHASTVINLQTGRPFSRGAEARYNIISLDQRGFIVDLAGGPRRYDFQNLIDFSIGKRWQLTGRFVLKTDLQVFNLLNSTAVIGGGFEENQFDEGVHFEPWGWVRPRRLMLRIGLEY